MKTIANILVGIDFSASSDSAAIEAMRIAKAIGAQLTAIHVLDSDLADHVKQQANLSDGEMRQQASARLVEHMAEVLGGDQQVTAEVLIGDPFVEMLRASKNHAAGLLVLGSGGTEVGGGQAGDIARRCVRKVPTKVLLVRQRQREPFRRVVACADFSDTSKEAIELAAQVAKQDGAELHLLNVSPPVVPGYGDSGAFAGKRLFDISLPPYPDLDFPERQKKRLDELANELLGADHGGLTVETHVFTDAKPAHGIVEFLNQRQADLVVLGTRGRTGLRALFMGTTAERIVDHSPCSVLAIKPDGFHYEA